MLVNPSAKAVSLTRGELIVMVAAVGAAKDDLAAKATDPILTFFAGILGFDIKAEHANMVNSERKLRALLDATREPRDNVFTVIAAPLVDASTKA